jgi:hypothetical protein
MNKHQMAEHITDLCEAHKITVESHSSGGRAYKRKRIIYIRPVRSAITYATALHEIGHILGPWQSLQRLFSEAGAWVWAKENARVWTPPMQRDMEKSLDSYAEWALDKRARKVCNAPTLPPHDHAFWQMCTTRSPEHELLAGLFA